MKAAEELGGRDLRRSGRILKEVAILLSGCDVNGKQFIERTKTVVLSRYGAGIVSKHKLIIEQELILVHTESNKEADIRIVGQIGSGDGSYTYGVAFLRSEVNFWGVEFPSLTAAEISVGSTPFQCTICRCREIISHEAFELDAYAIHGRILRDCKHCMRSTLWNKVFGVVPEPAALCGEAVSCGQAAPSETRCATVPGKNRRKHPRTTVNFTACIRNPGADDRLVHCENASRGGLCFKSSKRYTKRRALKVLLPTPPGQPVFVSPPKLSTSRNSPMKTCFATASSTSI